jgi:hypothetical protein
MRSIPPMYDREQFAMEYNEIQGDLLDEYQAIQAMEFPIEEEYTEEDAIRDFCIDPKD